MSRIWGDGVSLTLGTHVLVRMCFFLSALRMAVCTAVTTVNVTVDAVARADWASTVRIREQLWP